MQPRAFTHMRDFGRAVKSGGHLSMLSIGCGDGELECSFLAGLAEQTSRPSIHFVGIDPNPGHIEACNARIMKEVSEGILPKEWIQPVLRVGGLDASLPAELNERFDIVLLGHVMYYFEDKWAALETALSLTKPTGEVCIVHQGPEGIPEIQKKFTKSLTGQDVAIYTADDVEKLCRSQPSKIGSVERLDHDCFLDVGPTLTGTDNGLDVLSFAIECDLRSANATQVSSVCDMVRALSVPEAETGRAGGPFLRETVSVLTVKPVSS